MLVKNKQSKRSAPSRIILFFSCFKPGIINAIEMKAAFRKTSNTHYLMKFVTGLLRGTHLQSSCEGCRY